jgi:hypothetical protein
MVDLGSNDDEDIKSVVKEGSGGGSGGEAGATTEAGSTAEPVASAISFIY